MKQAISTIITCCLILFVAACAPSSDEGESVRLMNSDVTHSGCTNLQTRDAWKEGIVLLKSVNNNKLQINHFNAVFNCEPGDITIETRLSGNKIIVTEKEQQSIANCICPYNLLFCVDLPSHGEYRLIINDIDFGIFEFNADTDITLKI